MKDLIKRLREAARLCSPAYGTGTGDLEREAADAIERLTFEGDQLHKQYLGLQEDHQKACEELEAIACRCESKYDVARVPYSRGDGLWACSTCGKVRASRWLVWE